MCCLHIRVGCASETVTFSRATLPAEKGTITGKRQADTLCRLESIIPLHAGVPVWGTLRGVCCTVIRPDVLSVSSLLVPPSSSQLQCNLTHGISSRTSYLYYFLMPPPCIKPLPSGSHILKHNIIILIPIMQA